MFSVSKKKKEKIYTLNYRLFNILFTPICIILLCRSRTRLSDFTFTFHFHALEKEMATHSSTLAWRNPWMEDPGGLQSMGPQRVGHDWVTSLSSAFSKSRLHIWKFTVHVLLKPGLENFEHYFTSMWVIFVVLKLSFWKVVVESCEYTGILGRRRRRIQSGARDKAWSLRAFV